MAASPARLHVGIPGVDHRLEDVRRVPPVRTRSCATYQSTARVDVAGPEVGEHGALVVVVLADVLAQHVHGVGGADETFEGAGRPDRAELAMVADEDRLGARPSPRRTSRRRSAGSSVMAASSTMTTVRSSRREPVVVEAPQQRRDRAALDQVRLAAEGAGRLPGRRRADHPVAGGLERRLATTSSMVVLPAPATPITSFDAPRPDVATPITASLWPTVRRPPESRFLGPDGLPRPGRVHGGRRRPGRRPLP